jgi:hypothetical protein
MRDDGIVRLIRRARGSKNLSQYVSTSLFTDFNDIALSQLDKAWYNDNPISLGAQQNNDSEP